MSTDKGELNMDSVKIWDVRWPLNKRSLSSTGSSIPESISEIYHQYEMYLVKKSMPLNHFMTVLDIGAGSGRWVHELAPRVKRVVAIEPTKAFNNLKKNTECFSNVECQKKSFEEYTGDEKFDVVIISGVLTYIIDDEKCNEFLGRAFNVVAPKGVLIVRDRVSRTRKIEMPKYQKNNKNLKFRYMEVSRRLDYYLKTAQVNNFEMMKMMPNHATVFYHCDFPVARKTIQKLILRVFNNHHMTIWYLYNACFIRLEALARKLFNTPKMYIMMFKKNE